MTKIQFHIDHKAAVLAGNDVSGDQVVEVRASELTVEERQTLAQIMERPSPRPSFANCVAALPYSAGWPDDTKRTWAVATVDSVREALADAAEQMVRKEERLQREATAKAEREAAEKRKEEEKVQALLDAGPEPLVTKGENHVTWWTESLHSHRFYGVKDRPEIIDLMKRAEALASERNAPIYAEMKAKSERENREARESAERIEAQKQMWLEVHGSESQKARAKRGLLPDNDLVDSMRDFYLRPLDGFPKYEKLTAHDLVAEYVGKPHFTVGAAETLSDEEFATLQQIEAAAESIDGQVICEPSIHSVWDDENDDTDTVYRTSIKVTATIGDLTFSRRYACP